MKSTLMRLTFQFGSGFGVASNVRCYFHGITFVSECTVCECVLLRQTCKSQLHTHTMRTYWIYIRIDFYSGEENKLWGWEREKKISEINLISNRIHFIVVTNKLKDSLLLNIAQYIVLYSWESMCVRTATTTTVAAAIYYRAS